MLAAGCLCLLCVPDAAGQAVSAGHVVRSGQAPSLGEAAARPASPVPRLLEVDQGSARSMIDGGGMDGRGLDGMTDGAALAGGEAAGEAGQVHVHLDGGKCATPSLWEWLRYREAVQEGLAEADAESRQALRELQEQLEAVHPAAGDLHSTANADASSTSASASGATAAASASASTAAVHISPSGKFRLIYDLTGGNAVNATDADASGVPDYVEKAAFAADSTYRYLVGTLGYPDPITPGGTYEIRFASINFYGYTSTSGGGTYIVVHSTFRNFPANDHPEGDIIGALYATIAHEFKHAIQYKTNRWSGEAGSFNWIEMDATMMEEQVFDDVNDYYNYLGSSSIFRSPHVATPGSYYHVTWMLYFAQAHGPAFWKRTWDRFQPEPTLKFKDAIQAELAALGGLDGIQNTLDREHLRNHLWHLTSGPRFSGVSFGFEEKDAYPDATLAESFDMVPDTSSRALILNAYAARYFTFEPPPTAGVEDGRLLRLSFASDLPGLGVAVLGVFQNGEVEELAVTPSAADTLLEIETEWALSDLSSVAFAAVNLNDQDARLTFKVGMDTYVRIPESFVLRQNQPNPFNPTTTIPFDLNESEQVRLEIFDATGRLVRVLADRTYPAGSHEVQFDASGLATGVYIFRLTTPSRSASRAMVLMK
jgi:hypothetical protein